MHKCMSTHSYTSHTCSHVHTHTHARTHTHTRTHTHIHTHSCMLIQSCICACIMKDCSLERGGVNHEYIFVSRLCLRMLILFLIFCYDWFWVLTFVDWYMINANIHTYLLFFFPFGELWGRGWWGLAFSQ